MLNDYCLYCQKRESCKKNCHALGLTPTFSKPVKSLYVKNEDAKDYALFLTLASSDAYRLPTQDDEANKLGRRFLIPIYSGNAPRAVYQGYSIFEGDIGSIGSKFIDVWRVALEEGKKAPDNPLRLAIDAGAIYIAPLTLDSSLRGLDQR